MSGNLTDKLYRLEEDRLCGRQLVATRKISAGELIIDEPALVTGPGFSGGNLNVTTATEQEAHPPVCLVCCKHLSPSKYISCPSCTLQLCSESCRRHFQHSGNECVVFPKISHVWNGNPNRSIKSFYNLILVIRALFYKLRDSTKWHQLKSLESKMEALGKVGAFSELEDVFSCLRWEHFSSLSCPTPTNKTETKFDMENEDIVTAAKHCLAVMRINAFSSFNESYSREGLFFLSSFMSHGCVINTDRQMEIFVVDGSTTAGSDGDLLGGSRMVVRASVDIEKDEPITTTYLSLLYNREERTRILISNWLFTCHCRRCQNPTEYEAFSTDLSCKCIDLDSTGSRSFGKCSCNTSDKGAGEDEALKHVLKTRPKNLSNISKVEDWLDSSDKLSHPYSSIFSHVKLFLCQCYGRQAGGIGALSVSQLKRKVVYCQQILHIFDKTMPGIQMCRGVILFELWCALDRLSELKMLPVEIPCPFKATNSQSILVFCEEDVSKFKNQAQEILKFALPNSSEEAMANLVCENSNQS